MSPKHNSSEGSKNQTLLSFTDISFVIAASVLFYAICLWLDLFSEVISWAGTIEGLDPSKDVWIPFAVPVCIALLLVVIGRVYDSHRVSAHLKTVTQKPVVWELSETHGLDLLKNAADCVMITDEAGHIVYRSAHFIASGREHVIETATVFDCFMDPARDVLQNALSQSRTIEQPIRFDIQSNEKWYTIIVRSIEHENKENATLFLISDISKERELDMRLKASEKHFQSLTAALPIGIVQLDLEFRCLYVNMIWAECLQKSNAELMGDGWSLCLHADYRASLYAALEPEMKGTYQCDCQFIDSQGETVWANVSVGIHKDNEDSVCGYLLTLENITDKKDLQKEILLTSENEQLRIGQDLHDDLGGALHGIGLSLSALSMRLDKQGSELSEKAQNIGKHVRDALKRMRLLTRGLSPVLPEEDGLQHSLADLCTMMRENSSVECLLNFSLETKPIELAFATNVYYLIKEAVHNAVRHGSSSQIAIDVVEEKGHLHIQITDNGVGITAQATRTPGRGIRFMKYRADTIGGSLFISPAESGGTEVVCSVDL